MAIFIEDMTLPITPQEALSIIQSHTARMGVFIDLDRVFEVIGVLLRQNSKLEKKFKNLCLDPSVKLDDKNAVIEALVKMGVKRSDLYSEGSPSLAATVLKPLVESGDYDEEITEAMTTYSEYSSNKSIIGTLRKSYTGLPRCKALSHDNHRMVLARSLWSLLSTSRIQSDSPNVQGLARTLGDVMTYPKGYIFIRTDSCQIEPRINFSHFTRDELIIYLIKYYKDAYFGILHYCLMSDEELSKCRISVEENFNPMEITDAIKDKRQVLKRLTNAGSYGSHNLGNVDMALHSSFDKRIVNHPARLAREREVANQVARGDTTFYGAFGTPVTPDSTSKHQKGDNSWTGHVIRCGINNPVQTTASELMIHSVYAANKRLAQAKDSAICYYKHDEGAFLVSEEDAAKDSTLVDDLCDITAYNVKGWIPIPADPIIGMKEPTLPSYL